MKSENQDQDSTLAKLENWIREQTAQVSKALQDYRLAKEKLAQIDADLDEGTTRREQIESERSKLENASALSLHRLGMSAEKAAERSDELLTQVTQQAEAEELVKKGRTEIAAGADGLWSYICQSVKPLNSACQLYSEGLLQATLSSWFDPRFHVVPLFEGADSVFRGTVAHNVYQDRTLRINKDQWDLAFVDDLIREPIVPLEQRAPELPHPNSSKVVESIWHQLRATPVVESPPFVMPPPGPTSADQKKGAGLIGKARQILG